jgi:3-deoxy-D-manno-octulosonic-acid transferase
VSRATAAWSAYRAALRLALPLLPAAAALSPKLGRGLAGRRGLLPRLRDAAPLVRGGVWLHATSVGEYEQARPILRRLRELGVGPLVVTHFSPSGREYAASHPEADLHDYLPLDRPADMRELVAAWRPRALVFVKYDCWPNLVVAAGDAGVPVLLLSGALPPGSLRRHPLLRPFYRDLFDRFARLGVGSAADRDRFVAELGVSAPVVVSGDTRAEQVLLRHDAAAADPLPARLASWGDERLVLGSTWPPDEALWWPVLPELLRERPGLRIVLVPHEPTPARVAGLLAAAARRGVPAAALSGWDVAPQTPAGIRLLVIDRVGVLAGIYRAATAAYVGGSFTTGVHSTLEPAAAAVPVGFGPRIANAEEAVALTQLGAGTIMRDPAGAAAWLRRQLEEPGARRRAGEAARGVVEAQRGAAARSVDLLLAAMAERHS